ncbi:MAG: polysaccharide biosynthesis tyrosine autokinase, partial [Gemmataceae bacterium]
QEDLDKHKNLEEKKKDLERKIENVERQMEFTEQMKQQYLMTKDNGGYEAQELGRSPEIGSEVPSRKSLMVVAGGIFGAALGGGLAWLLERSDKTFKSPDEIRQRLGLPVLGHVPLFPPMDEEEKALCKIDPTLITFHNPKSQEAEFFRGLRTALYFSTQGQGHQVLQTTSPTAGDGKSTTSANLAISLAQSGKKIVLLDADFRKPRVHKIFRLDQPEVGLASVVNGEATLQEAIHTCEVPGLHLMPCGPRPANPSELLTTPKFQEVIEELRKMYDIVMVDTPPILAVSDPSIVAPRVDGVLMVMRVTRNGRPAAEQAAEVLGTLGAKVLGVVVNGYDPREASKYGYGYGYGYKYSYGYKYGYKYGYNYSDYESYTDDEDEENEEAQAEEKRQKGPSMASRVLPSIAPRIQTKRLPPANPGTDGTDKAPSPPGE